MKPIMSDYDEAGVSKIYGDARGRLGFMAFPNG